MTELVIQIDPATAERLSRLSSSAGQTMEQIALGAILERMEDLEDAPAARERLEEIDSGSVTPIPHEEAMRILGLAPGRPEGTRLT